MIKSIPAPHFYLILTSPSISPHPSNLHLTFKIHTLYILKKKKRKKKYKTLYLSTNPTGPLPPSLTNSRLLLLFIFFLSPFFLPIDNNKNHQDTYTKSDPAGTLPPTSFPSFSSQINHEVVTTMSQTFVFLEIGETDWRMEGNDSLLRLQSNCQRGRKNQSILFIFF